MNPSAKGDRRLALVTFLSFALGMAVALAIVFLWRARAGNLPPLGVAMALAVCPPFILSPVIAATPEAGFALVLGVGTILLANGFLYAGVAAGIYAVVTLVNKTHSPRRHGGHRED